MIIIVITGAIILLAALAILVIFKLFSETKIEKVNILIKEENYQKAKNVLNKLMKKKTNNYLHLWYNAKINYYLKDYEKALDSLKLILEIPSAFKELQKFQFHLMLADVFYKLNRPNSALNEYLLVTQYEPNCSIAYARIGRLFFFQRDNNNALKFLFKAVNSNSQDYYSYYLMGRIYYYMELYERSGGNLKESIKLNKKFYLPYYYLAQIEFARKRYQNALKYAGMELKKEGSDKWLKLLLLTARCYQMQDNYKHAIKFYEMLIDELPAEHPIRKDVYYYSGECYQKLNQIEDAVIVWEKLYYKDPKYKDITRKYNQYSDINNEAIIKDILKADNNKLTKIYDNILKRLSLDRADITFPFENISKILTIEIKAAYSYNVLVYVNRSFDSISMGILEIFLKELRSSGCKKGVYISLADFTSDAINYALKYPIDLINRTELLGLLKTV